MDELRFCLRLASCAAFVVSRHRFRFRSHRLHFEIEIAVCEADGGRSSRYCGGCLGCGCIGGISIARVDYRVLVLSTGSKASKASESETVAKSFWKWLLKLIVPHFYMGFVVRNIWSAISLYSEVPWYHSQVACAVLLSQSAGS